MLPNKLTELFITTDFSQLPDHFMRYSIDPDDIWRSYVPFCLIPDFALQPLIELRSWVQDNDHLFHVTRGEVHFNHWYTEKRSWGWSDITVIDMPDIYVHDTQGSINHAVSQGSVDVPTWFSDQCRGYFADGGVALRGLKIKRLEPGGWINPHRDLLNLDRPLEYFWMPLDQYHDGVKIFPYGEMRVKFGEMALLNNKNFPHAVWHRENTPRYVFAGYIDSTNTNVDFVSKISRAIVRWQNSDQR